jgi:hypothetical protein
MSYAEFDIEHFRDEDGKINLPMKEIETLAEELFKRHNIFCNNVSFRFMLFLFLLKGNLHNSTPAGGAICMPPFSILTQ